MKKPTVFHYIAMTNRSGGLKVLKDAGYLMPPKNPKMMADMLADYFKKDGEKAAAAIANIHPDREMILKMCAKPVDVVKMGSDGEPEQTTEYLSCDCNADATPEKPKKGLSETNIKLLILSGAAVLAIGLITSIIVTIRKK